MTGISSPQTVNIWRLASTGTATSHSLILVNRSLSACLCGVILRQLCRTLEYIKDTLSPADQVLGIPRHTSTADSELK